MRLATMFCVFCATACSSTTPATTTTPRPAKPHLASLDRDYCPLELDGATLAVKETELGVALEFTSFGDVAELRRRVRKFGDVETAARDGRHLEDVDGGARIVFPAELRREVEAVAEQLDSGACVAVLPTKPTTGDVVDVARR
jgi:hypothetical protein